MRRDHDWFDIRGPVLHLLRKTNPLKLSQNLLLRKERRGEGRVEGVLFLFIYFILSSVTRLVILGMMVFLEGEKESDSLLR